jgi:hypothetical protein
MNGDAARKHARHCQTDERPASGACKHCFQISLLAGKAAPVSGTFMTPAG